MNLPTESYETIHAQYLAAIDWVKSIGVEIGSGRTSHYEKVLGYWKDSYRSASLAEGEQIFPDFVSAMFEILEFVNIHKALEEYPPDKLALIATKLQKAVNGPIHASEESPTSTTARNFLFEATVAARANHPAAGIAAILDAPSDTGISIDGKKIWVECKRITSTNKIERHASVASKQLEQVFARQIGCGHRGIVALDVSKVFNSGDRIFEDQNDSALVGSIKRMLGEFISTYSHHWEAVYTRRSPKIIGTIVRIAFMSISRKSNLLVHAQQWALNPRLGVSSSDLKIQERLVSGLQ